MKSQVYKNLHYFSRCHVFAYNEKSRLVDRVQYPPSCGDDDHCNMHDFLQSNVKYIADFNFDLKLQTENNKTYYCNIFNIKNNLSCVDRDTTTECSFDALTSIYNNHPHCSIKINDKFYKIENSATPKEVTINTNNHPTNHEYDIYRKYDTVFYVNPISFTINFDKETDVENINITFYDNQNCRVNEQTNIPKPDAGSLYYNCQFSLNSKPTISDYDHYLGNKNNSFQIDYTVWDDNNDRLSVTQRLNYDTIGTYSNVASGTSGTIYITDDMLRKLPLNQKQYIYIIVDDGRGGQATRTWSFTRTNSAPSISGYDMDMGDKNVGFSINYTVSDADNDTFTITETLNGQTLRNIPNLQGSASETLTISNDELYKTTLNQKSTIIITANDGKGGISNRTYTFTRTNTPVAIGIIKKTYPTITFRCTDSNPNGYVRLVEVFINNNRVQSFTSGFDGEISYNIDFSYLNEGNNTLMIRATNNQNITSNKTLNVHKKSLKEPDVGTNIIVKGKRYQIINKKSDGVNLSLVLNKPLQNDVSKTDRIEILNDYCKVFTKTDENGTYQEMEFIKSRDLGNGYTEERYQLDITGRNVETRVLMYGSTAIKQVKEAFQYLED